MNLRLFSLVLAVWGAVTASVEAQQLAFATQTQGGNQLFAYRWKDQNGTHSLNFTLNGNDIARGSSEFTAWDEQAARTAAWAPLRRRASALSTGLVSIEVTPNTQGFTTRIKGPATPQTRILAETAEKELNTTYQQALQTYATGAFYKMTPDNGTLRITPDHIALAKRYTAPMGPVAAALKAQVAPGADARAYLNAALHWLQTIPYNTLQDRATSNGAGYQTPYGLMLGNKGDCDTKATALLALLRAAYPTLPLAIIYIPDHAFVGVGLPKGPEDFGLSTQYGVYVLADPTGPGLAPLGQIDDETQAQLRSHHTQVLALE